MNRHSRQPVVTKATGGKGGGGAVLTVAGERAVESFWTAYREFQVFLKQHSLQIDL